MNIFFEPVLLRLKEQLGLSNDKDVADLLGMTPAAFNNRKKRDSFPEDKLLALHARRPELNLDVPYILTGERAIVTALMGAVRAATQVVERLGGTKAERQARADVLLSSVVNASRASLSDEEHLLVGRYRAAGQALRNEVMRLLLGGESAVPAGKKKRKTVIHGDVGNQMGDNDGNLTINMGNGKK